MSRLQKLAILIIMFFTILSIEAMANNKLWSPAPIPDEMKKTKDAKSMRKYLNTKDVTEKKAAIRRLGEIGGSDAIDVLNEYFENEPYVYRPVEAGPGVKASAMTALGTIHEEKSRRVLLKILTEYEKRKPTFVDTGWEDGTRFHVLNAVIGALNNWEDADIQQKLSEISNDTNIDYILRQKAQAQYLEKQMKQIGLNTSSQQIEYLMGLVKNKESDWVVLYRNKSGPDALQAMRTAIALDMLKRFDAMCLPEMEQYYNRITEDKTEIRKAISKVMDYIRK